MKKLFTILIISLTVTILSSCIIVTNTDPNYNFTLENNSTDRVVRDWYVKNSNNENITYVIKNSTNIIEPGSSATISGIPTGTYYVAFRVYRNESTEFYYSKDFYIDRNLKYTVIDILMDNITSRNALTQNNNSSNEFHLIDSAGNEIELVKVSE